MHKSLGIIQIDLPEITLTGAFGSDNGTDITSLLNDEQKNNIKVALKGEKLIICNIALITDSASETISPTKNIYCCLSEDGIFLQPLYCSLGTFVSSYLYYDSENEEIKFYS